MLAAARVFVVSGLMLLATTTAEARSRHERVTATPIKEKGEVVGVKFKLTLRPQDSGHDRVRLGLLPAGALRTKSDYREHASGKKKGVLVHQWKEIDGLKTGSNKEVEVQLRYKDAPKLQPGQSYELVSAWGSGKNSSYWHVWGATTNISGKVETYKAPGTAKAAVAAAPAAAAPKAPKAKAPKTAAPAKAPKAKAPPKPLATRASLASARTKRPASTAPRTTRVAPKAKAPARRTAARGSR